MPGVTADLELDLADALRSIDQLDAALNQSIQSFSSSLAQSLDQLSSPTAVEIDATAVTSELDAAIAAADTEVEATADVTVVADTTEIPDEVDAALASADATVTVSADTTEATAQIEDLGGAAQGSAGAVGTLESATTGLEGASSLAEGSVGGLGAAIGSINPAAAAAVGGLAAVGGVIGGIFGEAVTAEGQVQSFDATLGAMADRVRNVQIDGLNTSLEDLATTLGSDDEKLLTATRSIYQLGIQDGKTAEESAALAQQIGVLGANAVATHPELGEVGDVANNLTKALARGGRALVPYGISLSAAEINARALRDTGKSTAAELTQVEKITASATLANEKFGSSIASNIEKGSQNSIITLARLKEQVTDTIEELGQPLIAPVFDLIRAAQPILIGVAGLFAKIGVAALPGITALVDGLSPLVDILADVLTPVLEVLGPILEGFGLAIGAIGQVVKIAFDAFKSLPEPIQALISPVKGLALAFEALGLSTPKPADIKDAAGATVELADGATLLNAALSGTPEEFAKLETTATGFAGAGVSDELRKTGLSLEDVRKQLIQGDAGFKQFVAAGIKAGTISITDVGTGAKYTAEQVANAKGNLDEMLRSGGVVVTQGQNLIASFGNQAAAIQNAARSELAAVAATNNLSQAQIDALPAMAQTQFGTQNVAAQLAVLNQGLANGTIQTNAQTAALGSQAATWVALAQNIAAGTITEQNADLVAQQLGLTHDQVTQAINLTSQAVDNFVNNAVSKVPTAASVFDSLKTTTNPADPSSLASNLNAATLSTLNFGANIEEIGKRFPEVAALLAQKGPEAAGALASTFLASTDTQKQALEDSIKVNEEANRTYGATIKTFAQDNITAATDLATGMTTGFGEGLDFDGVTKTQVDEVTKVLQDGGALAPPKQAANADGVSIGDQLAAGMALGIGRGTPAVEQAARDAVTRAKNAANAEAGIRSPSTLFAEIGVQMGAGMAVGLSDAGDQVVAEAESIVARAAAAIASPATGTIPLALPNLPVGAGVGGGFGGAGVGDGSTFIEKIEINVTLTGAEATAEKAAMVGSQIGDALAARLEAQQARVTARNV